MAPDTLECGECAAPMRIVRVEDGRSFWGCSRYPDCRGTMGAHPDGTPMGRPGDAETRAARRRAHEAFDRIWEPEDAPMRRAVDLYYKAARAAAYAWMRCALKLSKSEAHIAMLDRLQCDSLIRFVARPRFEVRWIDTWNRNYVLVHAEWWLVDAALAADAARATGDDYVVWDRLDGRVVYDSRWFRPLPIGNDEEEDAWLQENEQATETRGPCPRSASTGPNAS